MLVEVRLPQVRPARDLLRLVRSDLPLLLFGELAPRAAHHIELREASIRLDIGLALVPWNRCDSLEVLDRPPLLLQNLLGCPDILDLPSLDVRDDQLTSLAVRPYEQALTPPGDHLLHPFARVVLPHRPLAELQAQHRHSLPLALSYKVFPPETASIRFFM